MVSNFMEAELYLKREGFFSHKILPSSGTVRLRCVEERNFFVNYLKSNGYEFKDSRYVREGKFYWHLGSIYPDILSVRWKDFDDESSAFEEIWFENMFELNPEFEGYHTGRQYGI